MYWYKLFEKLERMLQAFHIRSRLLAHHDVELWNCCTSGFVKMLDVIFEFLFRTDFVVNDYTNTALSLIYDCIIVGCEMQTETKENSTRNTPFISIATIFVIFNYLEVIPSIPFLYLTCHYFCFSRFLINHSEWCLKQQNILELPSKIRSFLKVWLKRWSLRLQ